MKNLYDCFIEKDCDLVEINPLITTKDGTVMAADSKVTVDSNKEIEAESIIISTGATAKYLGIPSEERLKGGGVSACAVCDGFFYKGQEVAIVGGGDTAAEEATYLANICSKVTMLVRKSEMRASKAMQHRVTNTTNIDLRYNHEIEEVLGDQVVEGLRILNNQFLMYISTHKHQLSRYLELLKCRGRLLLTQYFPPF